MAGRKGVHFCALVGRRRVNKLPPVPGRKWVRKPFQHMAISSTHTAGDMFKCRWQNMHRSFLLCAYPPLRVSFHHRSDGSDPYGARMCAIRDYNSSIPSSLKEVFIEPKICESASKSGSTACTVFGRAHTRAHTMRLSGDLR